MDSRLSWLALNLIPGMGSVLGRTLYETFGSVEKICQTPVSCLCQVEKVGPELAKRISSFDLEGALKKEQEHMALHGINFITLEDPDYPELLRHIFDPPSVLYIKGSLSLNNIICLAIIGSRRPTLYGKSVAKDMALKLAGCGVTIVSGMARGIDTMAHQGALEGHGRTIAVMGSGLDYIYPPENKSLMEDISLNGAVISEFPLGTPPFKKNFPMRNRIISGLALGTLVVEAGEKSGALITARLALEQGREVFAVPGPIKSWASKGTNGLIKQGAKLVDDIGDIFEELGPHVWQAVFKNQLDAVNRNQDKSAKGCSAANIILKSLADGPVHIDTLIKKSGIPAQEMMASLIRLEMEGIVRQFPGNVYVKI